MNKEQLALVISKIDSSTGHVRGFVVDDIKKYIKEKEGDGGLKKYLEYLSAVGFPVNAVNSSSKQWVNFNAVAALLSICKNFFHWQENDLYKMGEVSPQLPLSLKLFVSLAMDPKKMFKALPVYWESIFDFGLLEPIEFEDDLQHVKIAIKNFETENKDMIMFLKGYLVGVAKLIIRGKEVSIEESSRARDDKSLEYVIYWKK